MTIHRRPDLYHDPNKFIPERWLNHEHGEGDEAPGRRGAWRPFENGPRKCIGQELVMIEIKIVMALTLRMFDVSSVYDEFDELNGLSNDAISSEERKKKKATKVIKHAGEDRAYQVLAGTAKPADGIPARVKRRF